MRGRSILLVLIASVGCRSAPKPVDLTPVNAVASQPSSQWILESYDSVKGYTFSKDGVSYQTKCFRIEGKVDSTDDPAALRGLGYVLDGSSRFHMDIKNQSQCNELLNYIHKPVTLTNGSVWGPDVFLVDRPEGATIYLQVMNAK